MASALILEAKHHSAPSVFHPENLLREARRQKNIALTAVPNICVLDPDGDMVRQLRATDRAQQFPGWACYHTDLWTFETDSEQIGIVGCAVGAPFAVLVAEQLFASGCQFLISITSAGRIAACGTPPYFILIERALRDEGTSYHYLPPAEFAEGDPGLIDTIAAGLGASPVPMRRGATWTTDAPFRETHAAIQSARLKGALAVEMEAAALYAFSRARQRPVICFAHVTNTMAQGEGDFEKGESAGTEDAMLVILATIRVWREACRLTPNR
jgi:uridine phosphorylase